MVRGSRILRTLSLVVTGAALLATGLVPGPAAAPAEAASSPPWVNLASYMVIDADTGVILGDKAPHAQYPPASTMKVLTADTLMPRLDPAATVVPAAADFRAEPDGSAVGMTAGVTYSVEDLWHAVFLVSGNDAIAELSHLAGGQSTTLGLMRSEARSLGAYDTVVGDADGYDLPGMVTSAYDLALFARAGMAMSQFRGDWSLRSATFPEPGGHTRTLNSEDPMLLHYPGMVGGKGGITTNAGHTYVGVASRGGHTLIVTGMHGDTDIWDQVTALLNWGFAVDGETSGVGRLKPLTAAPATTAPVTTPSPTVVASTAATSAVSASSVATTSSPASATPASPSPVALPTTIAAADAGAGARSGGGAAVGWVLAAVVLAAAGAAVAVGRMRGRVAVAGAADAGAADAAAADAGAAADAAANSEPFVEDSARDADPAPAESSGDEPADVLSDATEDQSEGADADGDGEPIADAGDAAESESEPEPDSAALGVDAALMAGDPAAEAAEAADLEAESTEAVPDPEVAASLEPAADPGEPEAADSDAEAPPAEPAEPDAGPQLEPALDSEPDRAPESEPASDLESVSESGSQSESESAPRDEDDPAPQSEPRGEFEQESEPEPASEADPTPEPEPASEPDPEPDRDSD